MTCDVPVIVLSGEERPDVVRRARQAGCRFFLRKPYDPNVLLALVMAALSDAA
jgi:CheY-like chemotaxis protein